MGLVVMEGMNPPPQAAAWAVSQRPVACGDTRTRIGGPPSINAATSSGSLSFAELPPDAPDVAPVVAPGPLPLLGAASDLSNSDESMK
jgi:hypothetical protein